MSNQWPTKYLLDLDRVMHPEEFPCDGDKGRPEATSGFGDTGANSAPARPWPEPLTEAEIDQLQAQPPVNNISQLPSEEQPTEEQEEHAEY